MEKGILIGIGGASGSGKTLIAKTIIESIGSDKVILVQEDSYYSDLAHLSFEERAITNFDHPNAFDHDFLLEQLILLLKGESINQPIYDFTNHTRRKETKLVTAKKVIILEGILVLNEPKIRELMDICAFVDTMPDICFIRRLKRDIEERSRDLKSVIDQYMRTVRPMYFQFIEPSKRYADIIIPRGGKNKVAIDILTSKINDILQKGKDT